MQPGTLDGRVELRELVGEGGMGEVHAAWDRTLERAVAVKFVRGSGPLDAERLLLEARLQARVEHPHVVRVFEVGSLQGRPCILFQLVRGRSLAELSAGLSLADRVELVRQASTGLHAAHLQGLVHRDVKPGNILVEEAEEGGRTALVTDFGLAHAEEGGLTRSGLLPGTLDFMAPEQLAGEGPVDFRSDVYALGATLYAVLAGRPPFRIPSAAPEAGSEGQVRLLHRILGEEPPPLTSLAPGVPGELAVIVEHAMEKEPAARYPSAQAFAEDLGRFQRGEPIRARQPTSGQRLGKWIRKNRTASRAIAAALAVLLAAGAFALWQSRQAAVEAQEAARLGAVASSLESRLLKEYLLPPHDLRPALKALRAEVEALRPLAARPRGGPASFALGIGLELLGDLDGARAAYERAWSAGFHSPKVSEGLGNTLAGLYRDQARRVYGTLEPAAREARLKVLQAELRDPAALHLQAAGAEGVRRSLLPASIALLEGDLVSARARAEEVLEGDVNRYEARALQAEAWLEEAARLRGDGRLEESLEPAARAVALLTEAERWARSDPSLGKARVRALEARASALAELGRPVAAELAAVMEAIERTALLDPDDPALLVLRADALAQQASAARFSKTLARLPWLEEAATLYRRAAALDGGQVGTLCGLARALYAKAYVSVEAEPEILLHDVEEGLAAVARAATRAPLDPEVYRARSLLHEVEADLLSAQGKPVEVALRGAVAAGEEALRLQVLGSARLRPNVATTLLHLARETWRNGRDPRPDLERSLAAMEESYRLQPELLATAGNLAFAHATAAVVLIPMGGEAGPHLARGRAVIAEAIARRPGLPALEAAQGGIMALDALRLSDAGQDPRAVAAEAGRLLDSSLRALPENVAAQEARASLSLSLGRWRASQGLDPTQEFGRAERNFGEIAARPSPAHPRLSHYRRADELLARCAIAQARWLQRTGRPAAPPARTGLTHVAKAIGMLPRDPELRALRAELLAFAGERAAARTSLDEAYAMQPLVRGGLDARAAEAALAR